MNNFEFSPADGLMNKNTFPTNLGSETEARQQFMTLFNQLKDFINTDIVSNLTKGDLDAKTVNGKNIFVQQSQPTATKVGDIWISW